MVGSRASAVVERSGSRWAESASGGPRKTTLDNACTEITERVARQLAGRDARSWGVRCSTRLVGTPCQPPRGSKT